MPLTPIIFFVDPAWRRESLRHIPLLYPFWGNSLTEQTPFQRTLFERYSFDTRYYRITGVAEEADAVLMPYSHNVALQYAPDILEACIKASKQLNKPLFIDGMGDIEHPIAIPHAYVLRYGGYRFLRKGNEIIVPPYTDDLLEAYCGGALQVRRKSAKPIVGFVGWAEVSLLQKFKTIVKEFPNRLRTLVDSRYGACKKGVFFRMQAIGLLKRSPLVASNFLLRPSYSGHLNTAADAQETLRREFVDTLLASDYCLDVRGDANNSMRLFEILSLGRIPVIVDTERNFPFSEHLKYQEFSLMVDFRDIKKLPEHIAEFHRNLTEEQFENMQKKARAVYLQYFRIDALMPYIAKEISERMDAFIPI
ncbi:MAG: exostosin family protein [Minisyncoccia bacterium]|jgi:hypothetical protein